MKKINEFWNWINGNKTVICALTLAILQSNVVPMSTDLNQLLVQIVAILTGGALIHKVNKKVKGTK